MTSTFVKEMKFYEWIFYISDTFFLLAFLKNTLNRTGMKYFMGPALLQCKWACFEDLPYICFDIRKDFFFCTLNVFDKYVSVSMDIFGAYRPRLFQVAKKFEDIVILITRQKVSRWSSVRVKI